MSKTDQATDSLLINQYLAGDKAVLPILVKRYHKQFCEKAYWVTKDKVLAKDVAQESWIVIMSKLEMLQQASSFKRWAFRIVYTKAIDTLKKRQKETEVFLSKNTATDDDHKATEDQEQKQKLLLDAIQKLPKQKQDIVRLFYSEEYSVAEISSFLDIPKGTVKSRLFKAREKLKTILKTKS